MARNALISLDKRRFDKPDPIDVLWAILNQVQERPDAPRAGASSFTNVGGDHVTRRQAFHSECFTGPSPATQPRDV